jgi:catalase (peroxidase I)
MKKTKVVPCRFSPDEYAELKAKAASSGLSVSALVRESVTKIKAWTPAHATAEKERVRQVARIGNNLNQIARAVNQQGVVNHEIDILRLLQSIQDDLRKSLGVKA